MLCRDLQIALSAASYPVWTVSVSIPEDTTFQYKFIRKETDGSVRVPLLLEPCAIC